MNPETITLITEYLDKIGEKLGVGAAIIWPWFVRQQYLEALVPVIFLGTFAIAFICMLKECLRLEKVEKPSEGIMVALCIFCGIGTLASFMVFCTEFFDIFNVEYWALKDLIFQVKP